MRNALQNNRQNTTIRDRHRRTIRLEGGPCGICYQEIDYSLKYPDPGAFVVDHIRPINRGGLDVLDNKQPAHNACNREKSDLLPEERKRKQTENEASPYPPGVTYETWRTW